MRRYLLLLILILSGILADAFSKWYFENIFNVPQCVEQRMTVCGRCNRERMETECRKPESRAYMPIIGEYLGFQTIHNEWIAFSIPIEKTILLPGITLLLVFGICWQYIRVERRKTSKLLDIGYSLVFAGWLCHFCERIMYGYVTDFIALKYFAIFNIADMMVSVGVWLILYQYIRYDRNRDA